MNGNYLAPLPPRRDRALFMVNVILEQFQVPFMAAMVTALLELLTALLGQVAALA